MNLEKKVSVNHPKMCVFVYMVYSKARKRKTFFFFGFGNCKHTHTQEKKVINYDKTTAKDKKKMNNDYYH